MHQVGKSINEATIALAQLCCRKDNEIKMGVSLFIGIVNKILTYFNINA